MNSTKHPFHVTITRDFFLFIIGYNINKVTFQTANGDVAQMVERSLSMREVRGSIPRISILYFFFFVKVNWFYSHSTFLTTPIQSHLGPTSQRFLFGHSLKPSCYFITSHRALVPFLSHSLSQTRSQEVYETRFLSPFILFHK